MAAEAFDLSLRRAAASLKLMGSHRISPFPKFYELLYGFVSQTDPSLTENLTRFFVEHRDDEDITAALYETFLKPSDSIGQLASISSAIGSQIADVDLVIGAAIIGTSSFSNALESSASQLTEDAGSSQLKALTGDMLAKTRAMQASNAVLNRNLQASQEQMAELRRRIEQVKRDADVDALTNLANRRSFDGRLIAEIAAANRAGSYLTIVMVDIDHFKRFNDTFGHQTGDRVLQLVAMTISAHTKGRDLAARYGGEEFVLLLPQTDQYGAVTVAENIRRALESKALVKRDTGEKLGMITASFGVATLDAADTSFALVERADRCLYAAKAQGRNRVVCEAELETTMQLSA